VKPFAARVQLKRELVGGSLARKLKMLDHLGQQQVWNGIHQGKPSSEYPEEEVVAFAQRLQRQLPPKSSVLDAGCGRGRNAFYLSQLGFTVHSTCLG
jgi:hypothetical protein